MNDSYGHEIIYPSDLFVELNLLSKQFDEIRIYLI